MKVEKPKEKYDRLIADGYCVVGDVLKGRYAYSTSDSD